MKKEDFTKKVVTIDESMREIASLDELYNDLLTSKPKTDAETESVKEQAKFARERMLRLSLHVKNILQKAEAQEKM